MVLNPGLQVQIKVNDMSREAFEAVIGKVIVESEFREMLLADPDRALAGFELTGEEISVIKKIDAETLDSVSGSMDAWVSRITHTEETGKVC